MRTIAVLRDTSAEAEPEANATKPKPAWKTRSVRYVLLLVVSARVLIGIWAALAGVASPVPSTPNEAERPYLGAEPLNEGIDGVVLGPWQRFDTQRYLRIARDGYVNPEDTVFPPGYPLVLSAVASVFGGGDRALLASALVISALATLLLALILHRLVRTEFGEDVADRAVLYLLLFPTGFFLFAGYSESLFILLAVASFWYARRGLFVLAGIVGFLAALTRLTGWTLVIPLAFEYWNQNLRDRPLDLKRWARGFPVTWPALGLAVFFGWRNLEERPSMASIYEEYWYQRSGIPGMDLLRGLQAAVGQGESARIGTTTLYLDLAVTFMVIAATVLAFKKLGTSYGLYSVMLLFFMLLPNSDIKPMFSASRYGLAFFPMFILLGMWGTSERNHKRIILPFGLLAAYSLAQFAIWGWVA